MKALYYYFCPLVTEKTEQGVCVYVSLTTMTIPYTFKTTIFHYCGYLLKFMTLIKKNTVHRQPPLQ